MVHRRALKVAVPRVPLVFTLRKVWKAPQRFAGLFCTLCETRSGKGEKKGIHACASIELVFLPLLIITLPVL